MTFIRLATLTALAIAALAPAGARAADPDFCNDYAGSAVHQSERALHTRSCEFLVTGGRFSTEYRNHFAWCRGVDRHQANEERARRHEALERCGAR
jgi:hypothetical protein